MGETDADEQRADGDIAVAFAFVGVRLLAISAFATGISQGVFFAVQMLSLTDDAASREFFAGQLAYGSAQITIAVILWTASRRLARAVAAPIAAMERVRVAPIVASDIVAAGSFLVGGFYLLATLPKLAFSAGHWLVRSWAAASRADEQFGSILPWDQTANDAAIVLAALFVMLRPRFLVSLFKRLRSADLVDDGSPRPNGND